MSRLQKVSNSDDRVFLSERCFVVAKRSDDDDKFSRTLLERKGVDDALTMR